jgi:hypothetical protein
LSSIAEQYGFGHKWQPIRNLNLYKKILTSPDATKIPAGKSILIPRKISEYDEAIRSFNELLSAVDKDAAKSLRELDEYKRAADRFGTTVDIVADIAFAAKGAVKASIKLGPRFAKYIIRKEALSAAVKVAEKVTGLGNSGEELVIKNAGKAVVDQSVMLQAKRTFDAQKSNKSFATGMAGSFAKKAAVTSAKVVAPVEMANGIGEVVDVLCDVALAAGGGVIKSIEAIAPSKVAKGFVWFQSGEHPDDTHARMKRFVQSTNRRSADRLRSTITKLQSEKQAVYSVA